MQLLSVTLLAAATTLVASAPTTPNDASILHARMDDSCSGKFGMKVTTPNGISIPAWISWEVNIAGAKYYTKDECGSGFLDNFRGRCGVITD